MTKRVKSNLVADCWICSGAEQLRAEALRFAGRYCSEQCIECYDSSYEFAHDTH